jgi:hypothetical protein
MHHRTIVVWIAGGRTADDGEGISNVLQDDGAKLIKQKRGQNPTVKANQSKKSHLPFLLVNEESPQGNKML